ncbi:PucR family transcriptional regulator [Oceanobacillus sp. Castelsardo]|uniref:PucR family transcriptional regulator n=1 Tax=Oceanobacillus sp. Castelsardo TaxID=1851204 RepID=UPI000837EFD2|nr:PucR family transcriptional regulator [Oceanobacillus sp. Castelsardo]
MDKWQVTVNDVLSRDLFRNCKLVAGSRGLDREVKWTHILEMSNFESFINGGELILTTGSSIHFDSPKGIDYLEKLRKKNIAGVCIELGTHVKTIHPDIIQYGNDHHIPLITFDTIVKFVDITQDLHTLIINHHHHMLNQINVFSQRVNELSLMPNGILKILKELHCHLDIPVIFLTDDSKTFYYPPQVKDDIPSIKTIIGQNVTITTLFSESNFLLEAGYTIFPIKIVGNTWGNLFLKSNTNDLDKFSDSLIDRAILAITQIMLRNRTIEERKQNLEEEIIRKLLQGKDCDADDIQKVLPAQAKNFNYRLFLIETPSFDIELKDGEWDEIKMQQSLMIRSLFRTYGFIPSLSVNKNEITVIASFFKQEEAKKDTERFTKIIEEIGNIQEQKILIGKNCRFGISNIKNDYTELNKSYKEAKDVIFIQSSNLLQTYFFENIGVYRILLNLLEDQKLEDYIHEYLGPIIRHDHEMKSDLLGTLSMYLNCLGSKKETADRLFIVRQTLYHRLEKIKELLGEDYMEPVNRQAIELALAAYSLLSCTKPSIQRTPQKKA